MHSTRSVAFTLSLVFSPVFFACGGASDASSAPSSTETGTATPATDAPPEPTAGTRGSAATGSEPPDASTSGDGGNTTSPPVASDAGPAPAPAYPPIDTSALAPCPTDTSPAQFVLPFDVDGVSCFNFTPVDVGEPASGENATLTQYAVRPATPAARLVLFLIGSGGHPSGPLQAGVDTNFYAAAVEAGNAVFAVSYKNQASIGSICRGDDTCYFPTRQSILLGTPEPGAGLTATLDESVVDRTARSLRYLAAGDPAGKWSSYLTSLDPTVPAAQAIDWTKIITAGHSQGGGHAAALGKLFPVARVLQLSSTCDTADGAPATWTDGTDGTWASDATQFLGLAAPSFDNGDGTFSGDTTCPHHADDWANLGMTDDTSDDSAETCGETGDTHEASIKCADNYPTWVSFLQ